MNRSKARADWRHILQRPSGFTPKMTVLLMRLEGESLVSRTWIKEVWKSYSIQKRLAKMSSRHRVTEESDEAALTLSLKREIIQRSLLKIFNLEEFERAINALLRRT